MIEKFDTENVEYNAWVIYFRDTSKNEARSFGKSSEEDLNPSGGNETAGRFRPKSRRLSTLRRNAAIGSVFLVNEKFHSTGKSSEVLTAEGENMKLDVKNDKTRSIERLTGRMEEECFGESSEEDLNPSGENKTARILFMIVTMVNTLRNLMLKMAK